MGWFSVVPWAVAAAVLVMSFLAQRKSIRGRRRRRIVPPLRHGVMAFIATSALLFVYILLQALRREDNRWLEGVEWIDIPEVGAADTVDNIASGAINPLIERYNQLGASFNQLSSQSEQYENLRRGLTHTFIAAYPFILYVLGGFVVFLLLRVLFGGKYAELNARITEQDHEIAYLHNKDVWRDGRDAYGHTAETGYPFDDEFDYTRGEGYKDYVDLAHAEERKASGSAAYRDTEF